MKMFFMFFVGVVLSLSAKADTHQKFTYITQDSNYNEVTVKAAVILNTKNIPTKIILPEFNSYRNQSGDSKPFTKAIPLKQKTFNEKISGYDLALEDVLTQAEVGTGQIAIYSQYYHGIRLLGGILVTSKEDIQMILAEFQKILAEQNDNGAGLNAFNKRCNDQTQMVLLPFIGDLPAVIPVCLNK